MIYLICILIISIWAAYMLIRNEAVYKFRVKTLYDSPNVYHKLPSYEDMIYKYWYVWDFERFKETDY